MNSGTKSQSLARDFIYFKWNIPKSIVAISNSALLDAHTTIPDFRQLFVLNKTFSHSLLQHSMKEPILRPMIYYVSDHRITKHNRHATIIGDHLLAPFQKPHRKPVLRMHRSEIVSANWQLR